MKEKDYVIEYYYDRPQRMWRVDVIDEENNVIYFSYVFTEKEAKVEGENLRKQYK